MSLLLLVAGVAVASAVSLPILTYLRDPYQLRRFPNAHPLAGLTQWWIVWCSLKQRRYKYVTAAHKAQGDIVRLSPTHISFAGPTAYKEIYGHGSSILKDDFYSHIGGDNPSMAQTTSKSEHARKRRMMSNVFSAKEVAAMEPRIQTAVEQLVKCIRLKSRGEMVADTDEYGQGRGWKTDASGEIVFDLRPWLNMFSYDAITAMFWSTPYNCLERGSDLVPAQRPSGAIDHVHAMASFHGTTSYLVPYAQLSSAMNAFVTRVTKYCRGARRVEDFGSMVRYLVTHRLHSPPAEPDLFSVIPVQPTPKHPEPIPLKEVMAECTTMLDAGNDTTQTSLVNVFYHLSLRPDTQTKLRTELCNALPVGSPVVSYQLLQHIPYLRAVLDESFRCRPPVHFGLPRKTVQPTNIMGHPIPAGVTVSSPLAQIHHDGRLFSDPDTFIPERWLTEESADRRNLKDYVLPFSLGGRACIGRNLAYMELSIVVAALVLSFEWSLDEQVHGQGRGMEICERLNANPKELWVRAKALQA